MSSIFETLSAVNVNDHVEKKGQFTYLSWPFAVAELRKIDPKATWETIKFGDKPYCQTDAGCFVEVAVTVDGITLSQIHPVLDARNQTIPAPNAFQINTSIQRCLVKAIALHGLGLYIYAGEDLPETPAESGFAANTKFLDAEPQISAARMAVLESKKSSIIDYFNAGQIAEAHDICNEVSDNDEKAALWVMLKDFSKIRSAIKAHHSILAKAD